MTSNRLRQIPYFQGLSDQELDRLSGIMRERQVADGDLIFRQGDKSSHVYIVRRGKVRVYAVHDGQEETYTSLTVGGLLGEIGVLSRVDRTATAVAEGPGELVEMRGEAFLALIEEFPNVKSALLQTMVGRFRADEAREARRLARQKTRARILPVFAACGGGGATTVTANLAGFLRELTGKEVAVLDLDLMFGDVGMHFGLDGGPTLAELMLADPMDTATVTAIAQKVRGGVEVYQAPNRPEEGEFAPHDFVDRILSALSERYDYILCDTSRRISVWTLDLFERAAAQVLVLGPEVTSLRNAVRWSEAIGRVGLPMENLNIVANKLTERDAGAPGMMKVRLPGKLAAVLPYDEAARDSLDSGRLLLHSAPEAELAKALRKLAGTLAGIEIEESSKGQYFWQRWT